MRNRNLKVSMIPNVDDAALEKETTKTASKFKKAMEGVGKVFGKMSAGAKSVGNAGHKALTGMQSGLALLDGYLSKLGEIKGIVESLTGKFGDNVDLANSLNTNVENLRQLHLAYSKLGVGEDMVNQALEKFQQLVASGEIHVEGDDLLGGYLGFMDKLQQMSESERNEWLTKMGGKNITANRKIMDANPSLYQTMLDIKNDTSDDNKVSDRELIMAESQAGYAMSASMDNVATMQLLHEMRALAELYASGASQDIIEAEKMIIESAQLKIDGYDGRHGSGTSMRISEEKRYAIEGAGETLGQSFFKIVDDLMMAKWKKVGGIDAIVDVADNASLFFKTVAGGFEPFMNHLNKVFGMVQDNIEANKAYYESQEKANADANHRDEV